MRRPLMIGMMLALALSPALADSYANARFGYFIIYPQEKLVPEREADNGDGRTFHARQGTAKMSVWGSYRNQDLEKTPQDIARAYESDCGPAKPAYQLLKPKLVAFSCATAAGRVIYQKTIVNDDVLRSVRFDYPASEHAIWEPIVNQVAGSLKLR